MPDNDTGIVTGYAGASPLRYTLTSTSAPSVITEERVRLARGRTVTDWLSSTVLPASSDTVQTILNCPEGKVPDLLGIGVKTPSLLSDASAAPKSTDVNLPVAAITISAGTDNTGGNSSRVGSVPFVYSSRFEIPSPSKSVVASDASLGSRPFAVSKASGRPSLSVSSNTTMMLAVSVVVLSAASDTLKVITVSPIANSVGLSSVTVAVRSPSFVSVAETPAKNATTAELSD